MDIKEIYAAFFLQHLQGRLEEMRKMRPDDLIKLGYQRWGEVPVKTKRLITPNKEYWNLFRKHQRKIGLWEVPHPSVSLH